MKSLSSEISDSFSKVFSGGVCGRSYGTLQNRTRTHKGITTPSFYIRFPASGRHNKNNRCSACCNTSGSLGAGTHLAGLPVDNWPGFLHFAALMNVEYTHTTAHEDICAGFVEYNRQSLNQWVV